MKLYCKNCKGHTLPIHKRLDSGDFIAACFKCEKELADQSKHDFNEVPSKCAECIKSLKQATVESFEVLMLQE